MMYWASVTDKH